MSRKYDPEIDASFMHKCVACERMIERKFETCYRCRDRAQQIPVSQLPQPASHRRPANHRGARTESTSTRK